MKIKKVISICIIIITIFVTASFNSVSGDNEFHRLDTFDFSRINSLSSDYSYGTIFWTPDTKIIVPETGQWPHLVQYKWNDSGNNIEKNNENELKWSESGFTATIPRQAESNSSSRLDYYDYIQLDKQDIKFKITNCSIDKDGEVCDAEFTIKTQDNGMKELLRNVEGHGTEPWKEPISLNVFKEKISSNSQKNSYLIHFILSACDTIHNMQIKYYKHGTDKSANIPYTVSSIGDMETTKYIGAPAGLNDDSSNYWHNMIKAIESVNTTNVFLDGSDGIAIPEGRGTIYYDKSATGILKPGINAEGYTSVMVNQENLWGNNYAWDSEKFTKGTGTYEIDGFEKGGSATVIEQLVNATYEIKYAGRATGIDFMFVSPYNFELPNPVKTVSKNIVYENETYEYTISQYVPNNYYASQLNFIDTPGGKYTSFDIVDDLNSNLEYDYTKIKIVNEVGDDVKDYFRIYFKSDVLYVSAWGSSLTLKPEFYGHLYKIIIPVSAKEGSGKKVEDGIIQNYAQTVAKSDNLTETKESNTVDVSLKYKLKINAKIDHGGINCTGYNGFNSTVTVTNNNIQHGQDSSCLATFQVADGYKVSKVTLDGTEIPLESLNNITGAVYRYSITDENIRQDIEHNLIVTTEPKDATLVVKYEDENGNTLAKTETTTKKFFDEYTTNAKQITGYKLKETPENATGTMTEESITVTYVYQPYSAKVEVTKMDNNTGKIITKENTTFALYEWQSSTNTWVAPTHINASTVNGTVSDGKGAILKEKTSGTKGTYTASMYYDIQNQGKFRIVEYTRPWGYTTTNWTREIQISQDNQIFTSQVKNTQVRGQINFKKNDAQVNYNNSSYGENYAQGDATLQGASYGVYAKENIISPDNGAVVYRAGQQVMTGMTDANGKITWSNLYLGKYYIQEITASTGYLKDSTQYEVDLKTYYQNNYYNRGNQTTANVIYQNTTTDAQYANSDKRIISKETIKKQRFQLTKLSLSEDSTMANPLQGAGFKIYLIKDLSAVKNGTIKPNANGSYNAVDFKTIDFTKEQTALDFSSNTNGVRIPELFSNEDGIVTSPELPYGKYVVIESTIPEGMQAIQPFIVDIYEDSRNPKKMIYPIDREFEARIRVIKKDATTGMPVLKASAAYRIWNITQNEYVEQWVTYPNKIQYGTESNPYRTTEEGYLLTPERLGMGEYELREVEAPEGYVIAGKEENPKPNVRFSINTNIVYEMDPDLGAQNAIISVEQENMPQLGTITVSKSGEFLSSSQEQENQYQFDYNQRPVTDAKFAIYAKEDIYTQDNQTDENGERIKIYVKNQFVTEVETNTEGKAIFERLPLGEYSIVETKAGEGFTLNTERKEVSLTYEGQDKAIIYRATEYVNERQKVSINIHKIDADTGESISGAEFGLYTEEVITYMDNSGATQTIPEGKLVLKATSGEDGIASFQDENLPLGKYYIKELQAPRGYVTSLERMDVDCSYASQEIDKIVRELEFTNTMIKVKIRVTDYETGANLTNTQVVIRDENGNDLGTYTTDNNGEIKVKGFEAEKKYSVEEVKAKNGYVKDLLFTNDTEDENELIKSKGANGLVIFKVKDSEELQIVTVNNKAKVAQLEIQKTGDVLIGTKYETQRIDTARLAVYTKEDIVHPDGKQGVILPKGTKIAEGQTQDGIITIEKLSEELIKAQTEVVQLLLERGLPLGEYEIKELEAPEGYELEEQPKSVSLQSGDDNQEIEKITVEFYNKRIGTPEDPPGDNPGGDNPGGGDTPGDNPGGGDSPGDNPGSGDSPGDNPGGGDTPGDNPGSGDMPEDNAGGGDTSGGTSGGGNSLNGGSNNKDGNNASNSANKTNSEAKSADMATKSLPKTGTEILPITILIVSILTLVLIEIKLMKRRKS